VGEIWLRSPSNGAGYWRRPEESREVFAAVPATGAGGEGWLRTGDLGFLDDGELYVTGRRKDVLIVHGVNYYPQDFEWLAREAHPLLAGELAIACAAGDADDRVTVVVESADRSDLAGAAEAASAAVRAVTAELPVITDVVVVSRGQLPRTTSGKARRQECARRLREDGFTVLARWPRRTD
jgi:acyl-CoA synthetase (AMP-forming)/AMP-acid ligase II